MCIQQKEAETSIPVSAFLVGRMMEKTPEEIAASLVEGKDYDWINCGLNYGEPYADLIKDVVIADIAKAIREAEERGARKERERCPLCCPSSSSA